MLSSFFIFSVLLRLQKKWISMKKIALITFLLMTSVMLYAQSSTRFFNRVFQDITVQTEIQYGMGAPVGSDSEDALYFDFYEPANDTMAHRPLVITVFGGAFVAGNRSWCDMEAFGDSLSHYGYAVASIDYRLLPIYRITETNFIRAGYMAAQDVSAAVRFFKGNCDLYGIDTNRIFVLGNSAGTIASMYFLWMDDEERPEETFEDDGWLGIGGHSDLGNIHTTGFPEYLSYSPRIAGLIAQWGGVMDTNIISNDDTTPVCLIHGTADETVPYEYGAPYGESFLGITTLVLPDLYGSYYLDQRLTSLDVEHELHTFEGKEHCFYIEGTTTLLPEELDTCFRIALRFMTNIMFDNTSPEGVRDMDDESILVFPNPVEDYIYLQIEDNQSDFSCELYDIQGKRLIKQDNASSINVSSLPSGTYILQINTNKGTQFQKVVKK